MKIRPISRLTKPTKLTAVTVLTAVAAALSSCAPVPPPNPNGPSNYQMAGPEVPAPRIEGYDKVPTGHPDPQGRPGMVVSPYRPYNIIDVKGYRSGDIVGDPSTAKINASTGQADLSTCKHFRIP